MRDAIAATLAQARRLVIKVGSALLVENDCLNHDQLAGLAGDIHQAIRDGHEVIVVSSGALALGCGALGLARKDITLEQSQAAAATGQIALVRGWQAALAEHNLATAQILLTFEDTEQRRRYLNARVTLQSLLKLGVVPIINENDTIATQELRYGDNDRLAARVASMVSADCLLLLSDVDGLYTASPKRTAQAQHIPVVTEINADIIAMAGESDGTYGSGGMKTKLEAAHIAMQAGCHMVLASGRAPRPLAALHDSHARATLFKARETPRTARKNWIAGSLQPAGRLMIDSGAEQALCAGKSLLPVGITHIDGNFERGDCVLVINAEGNEVGRGLTAYTAKDAARIIGHSSREIKTILGYHGRVAMIHRDDLVIG